MRRGDEVQCSDGLFGGTQVEVELGDSLRKESIFTLEGEDLETVLFSLLFTLPFSFSFLFLFPLSFPLPLPLPLPIPAF